MEDPVVILVLKDSEVKVAQMVENLVWDGSRVSRTFEMVDIIRGRLFMLASRLRGGRYDHSMQLNPRSQEVWGFPKNAGDGGNTKTDRHCRNFFYVFTTLIVLMTSNPVW